MANASDTQRQLDALQKFALLLRIDRSPPYLAEVEKNLWTLYGSRLDKTQLERIKAIADDLDRVLSLLEQIRLVAIKEESVDWRGALEENIYRLEASRKHELETRLAERKQTSLVETRIKLVQSLTRTLGGVDLDVIEFVADKITLDCADQPQQCLVEAREVIELVRLTTIPNEQIDDIAIVAALQPTANVLMETSANYLETVGAVADILQTSISQTTEVVSPSLHYARTLVATAVHSGLPSTTIDALLKNTYRLEALALQQLKPAEVNPALQLLTQPNIQLKANFEQLQEKVVFQEQLDRAIGKHVKLSGLTVEEQKEVAIVIKSIVAPVLAYVASQAESSDEKKQLTSVQRVFAMLGLDLYRKSGHITAGAISTAFANSIYTFDYGLIVNAQPNVQTFYGRRYAKSPLIADFFSQLYSLGTSQLHDQAMQALVNRAVAIPAVQKVMVGLGLKAVTAGVVEAGVVAAGAGAAAVTGPPGWVIALATIAISKLKDVISKASRWVRENWPKVVGFVGGIGAAVLAGFVGVPVLAAGAMGVAVGGVVQAGGIRLLGSGASRFFNGITGIVATEIATPILVIALVLPPILALFLFIINNSAYVVPQAEGSISSYPGGGNFPPGCPSEMWPVSVDRGQKYFISQGPGGAYSHGLGYGGVGVAYQEATDINVAYAIWRPDPNKEKYLVLATHPGVVVISDSNGVNGGNRIRLKASCGNNFLTGFEHLLVNYVKEGDTVVPGTPLGVLGNTGVCTDCPHLHYVFRNADASHKGSDQSVPPILKRPFIPKDIPQFCAFTTNRCNITVP